MDANDTTKICIKCGESFPATAEYFYQVKTNRDGLNNTCKKCKNAYHKKWYEAHRDDVIEYKKQYYEANHEKILQQSRESYAANPEHRRKKNRESYYRTYPANRDKIAESNRRWKNNNPDKKRIHKLRRRARVRNLPDTFTSQDWQTSLEYFNYCCAVCGNQLRDLFGEIVPHADHWIPIVHPECPGTIAVNMICLCSECNFSKSATLPHEWLERKYGKRKAKQILKRIEDYFEWVRSQ